VTGSLGRRYARALFGLAREAGVLAEAGAELEAAVAVFAAPAVRAVVLNPVITAGARRAVVAKLIARTGARPIVANLVRLLADRDRLAILADVGRAYGALVDRELGRVRVKVRSATALAAGDLARIETLAQRLTASRQVVIDADVDPDLLGGVVIDAAGTVYDGSLKTRLAQLAKHMAGEGA
jgi:F-type H+-transporting ATPase subunit delta